jgi:hypothetical protein
MGKNKKNPKTKTVSVKDLSAKSAKSVVGGRQTPKTDFGSVLRRGITPAADTAASKT